MKEKILYALCEKNKKDEFEIMRNINNKRQRIYKTVKSAKRYQAKYGGTIVELKLTKIIND